MAIREILKFKLKNVELYPGILISFNYLTYQQDPTPFVIYYNYLKGTNPNTGHYWNFIQSINLHYLLPQNRIKLLKVFQQHEVGRPQWKRLLSIPQVQYSFRRYIVGTRSIKQIKVIDDGVLEIKKAKHKKFFLPKGIIMKQLQKTIVPMRLSGKKLPFFGKVKGRKARKMVHKPIKKRGK